VSKANEGLSSALVHKEDLARHAKQAMRLLNLEKIGSRQLKAGQMLQQKLQ